jgi:hypothetical protein
LSRWISERPPFCGNSGFDLANGFRALPGIFLTAESMNFEATVVRHHVLEAKMRQPAELQ